MAELTNLSRADKLRALAEATARAALKAAPDAREELLEASNTLSSLAHTSELRIKKQEEPVKILPSNATRDELTSARSRQATRRGAETYLPTLSDVAQVLPNALLRCALFSSSRKVPTLNDQVLSGDTSLLVVNKTIASFNNVTVTLNGYELCQFDRIVYATCLDYYRERPLSPETENKHVGTTFYEFAKRMGRSYSVRLHHSIRASLLRLSFAQLRIRRDRLNLEVPKFLSVSFEDSEQDVEASAIAGAPLGSDRLWLRVSESVAELFGPGAWTALERKAMDYSGLQGWLASFYATHQGPLWLSVKKLHEMSGYESRFSNFRKGLCEALDKLKAGDTPPSCRISEYHFSNDGEKIQVHRVSWNGE
ncbi:MULTISPECIES: plasmid replication initiator TrfA [Alcaligenes]|uniref:plasmid replication initiator TrfA n=1 Tax=Alcaligenes TaxID=507 RepID=UPI002881364E|nr:plasmid replication initiator TrfA [Alcaligenes sp. AB3]MDT0216763.1 plasmid replication initiator TrfA [Alcaligenes sp. AB3]